MYARYVHEPLRFKTHHPKVRVSCTTERYDLPTLLHARVCVYERKFNVCFRQNTRTGHSSSSHIAAILNLSLETYTLYHRWSSVNNVFLVFAFTIYTFDKVNDKIKNRINITHTNRFRRAYKYIYISSFFLCVCECFFFLNGKVNTFSCLIHIHT